MTSSCECIREVIHRAASGMSAEQLQWRPEGKWSAAEILEHLSLTYKGSKLGLDRCIQGGKPLARRPALKDRIISFVVVKLGYMPSGRQAPEGTRPTGSCASATLEGFDEQLLAMDNALRQCEERFGTRKKLITHPILGPLTVSEWRKFHAVHARHHAKQIERLKANLAGKK